MRSIADDRLVETRTERGDDGLAGTGVGALIGHLHGGMARKDLEEIAEMLDESEAALIVVGEATVEGPSRSRPGAPRSR